MVLEYLKKIASVILVASVLIWALGKFARDEGSERRYHEQRASILAGFSRLEKEKTVPHATMQRQKDKALSDLESVHRHRALEYSFIGRLGHAIAPCFTPLGFNWQMSASLVSGLAAKEIIVSTMNILYQADTSRFDPRAPSSVGAIKSNFNHASAAAFMVFVLLYFPCFGALTAIRKESGGWRWAFLAAVYTTGLAWIISFGVYTLVSMLS